MTPDTRRRRAFRALEWLSNWTFVQMARIAHREGDLHEAQHILVAMNAGDTTDCGPTCPLRLPEEQAMERARWEARKAMCLAVRSAALDPSVDPYVGATADHILAWLDAEGWDVVRVAAATSTPRETLRRIVQQDGAGAGLRYILRDQGETDA
jgi:hypothetical protein